MFYIYHIPNVKIGMSKHPLKRVRQQGYTDFEILEEHDDIEVCSNREIELQKEYGYKVDKLKYNETDYVKVGLYTATKINHNQGKKNAENGHMRNIQKIGCSLGGRVAGKRKVLDGTWNDISLLGNKANIEKHGKRITAINVVTNEETDFKSVGSASRELNIHKRSIFNCLQGKQHQTKGYKFIPWK
jgi:hypothetical protein